MISIRGTALVLGIFCISATADDASARPPPYPSVGRWVCSAYGYSSSPTRWHTVSGSPAPSQAGALQSANEKCLSKGMHACERSGCTRY